MAVVDRQFRSSSPSQFFDDMELAGIVVPEGDPVGASIAVHKPGPPGQYYAVDYLVHEVGALITDAEFTTGDGGTTGDPAVFENRGWHATIRISGNRVNAISAQLDNYFRKNPAVDVETPANVIAKYDLHHADQEPPPHKNDFLIRQGTPEGGTTMFELLPQGDGTSDANFYVRKNVFG